MALVYKFNLLFSLVFLATCFSAECFAFFKRKKTMEPLRSQVLQESLSHLGKGYRWDSNGPDAFDCSGFVHYVLSKSLGAQRFRLPYSLRDIRGYRSQALFYRDHLHQSGALIKCHQAEPGDIVFFYPRNSKENNRIGIITKPKERVFITAQGRAFGVQEQSYSESSYWGGRDPLCYQNLWIRN